MSRKEEMDALMNKFRTKIQTEFAAEKAKKAIPLSQPTYWIVYSNGNDPEDHNVHYSYLTLAVSEPDAISKVVAKHGGLASSYSADVMELIP